MWNGLTMQLTDMYGIISFPIDISREVENRRREWVKDFLGEEAAANYQFGKFTYHILFLIVLSI